MFMYWYQKKARMTTTTRCLYCNASDKTHKLKDCKKYNETSKIVNSLLFYTKVEPEWKQMSRIIKLTLAEKLHIGVGNIHKPVFYERVHKHWLKYIAIDAKKEEETFDCAICYETYSLSKDKTTTLNCGHRFCSDCIFKHLCHNNGCPMCRQNAFTSAAVAEAEPTTSSSSSSSDLLVDEKVERIRQKRRLQRALRRTRQKN